MSVGIITVFGQSNCVGLRSNPALLPSSSKDAEIPFSHNIASQTAYGEYVELGPILVEDGGGNGFTDPAITIPSGFSSWGFGCEILCARNLHSTDRKVAVAKRATGSTALADYWNPQPEGVGWVGMTGYSDGLYDTLNSEGKKPYHLCGIFWQGENDAASQEDASNYEYNLRRLITFYRANIGDMETPFVICLTTTGSSAYRDEVQAAQKKIAKTVNNVSIYDPTGLPIYSDGVHFWQDAHVTSGNAISDIFKNYLGL